MSHGGPRPTPIEGVRLLLAIGVLLLLDWTAQRFAWLSPSVDSTQDALPPGSAETGAAVGLLLIGAWMFGRVVETIGLPRITGYLLFGIGVGPGALGLVTKDALGSVSLVNELAIAVIALIAGGEIRVRELRTMVKPIVFVLLGVCAAVFVFAGGAGAIALDMAGAVESPGSGAHVLLAVAVGVVMLTNSPAVIVALTQELGTQTAMSRLALAVTVCKDIVVIMLFAVVIAIGAGGASDDGSLTRTLAGGLGGSILAGGVFGLALAWYMHSVRAHLLIVLPVASLGIALICEALHLETLLVGLIAGMLMQNVWDHHGEAFFESLEDLSTPVYCVFFAVAGAKLELSIIGSVGLAALVLVAGRLAGAYLGVTLGAKLAGVARGTRAWLWTAFAPQAGIALALALIAAEALGEGTRGELVFSLLLATIAMNELIGPPLLSFGLKRSDSGTMGANAAPDEPPARETD
ncbi:MAG: cation:proton antiporter [Planctomycetota bacterium]